MHCLAIRTRSNNRKRSHAIKQVISILLWQRLRLAKMKIYIDGLQENSFTIFMARNFFMTSIKTNRNECREYTITNWFFLPFSKLRKELTFKVFIVCWNRIGNTNNQMFIENEIKFILANKKWTTDYGYCLCYCSVYCGCSMDVEEADDG